MLEGKMVSVRCAHGDTELYPLADIRMEVDGTPIRVEAAVADTLPVDVLLGTDVKQLSNLLGRSVPRNITDKVAGGDGMVVVTRARARQELEEEIFRRGKEVQSGVRSKVLNEDSPPADADHGLASAHRQKAEQLVASHQKATLDDDGTLEPRVPDITMEEMKRLQEQDISLTRARGVAESEETESMFSKRGGLLYRRWTPAGCGVEMEIEQLILPEKCRRTVLKLAHEIPIAGHLGSEKTRQRLLRRFYWPGVFKDVEEFCRSCPTCQKTSQHRVSKAPLIPLPIISEPFSRIAMDIVGPLPRSKSGNRYVLVICDYATRYLEAIPLRSIDAEHIAEELIKVFARVGVPREILTDQGSNFTSRLLAELYRLLHVHPIRTSPYHPQTDGLVERFNKTLKEMLRKTVTDGGKDWDRMIPYLLFAYREVPQSSTGFSPFELLYGRDVRGPLDVLKET